MTHNEIIKKFMIEYDKADVTSSYPSLTDYEIAVLLDKAYLALIAQKITGNNTRRASIESDIKSVADLQPLITEDRTAFTHDDQDPINSVSVSLPPTCQYFLGVRLRATKPTPQDELTNRDLPVKLIPYEVATKFFATPYNLPWIKQPVCYIQDNTVVILYDTINKPSIGMYDLCIVRFIKTPEKFVESVEGDVTDAVDFECSDTMAEELISLAIIFALENVESSRLATKINTKGLEA